MVRKENTIFDDQLWQGNTVEAQSILQDPNSCNLIDDSGNTLLHVAAQCGNMIITEHLLQQGWKVDVVNNNGNTPLILAVQQDDLNIINVLIKAGASVLINNNQGTSAAKIVLSSRKERIDILDALLKKVKEECLNDSLRTAKELLEAHCPLPRAVRLKDTVITRYMLENGCDVNEQDTIGTEIMALHQSVIKSDLENVRLLVEFGADVNAVDCNGRRPLCFSSDVSNEDFEILEFLLSEGAQLITDNGTLVEGTLFQYQDKETVEMLMEYNLDFSAKDRYGTSLLHYLALNEYFDPVEILKNKISNSFNINEQNDYGSTPLMYASSVGNAETVQFLLKKGAEVNIEDKNKNTALSSALFPQINNKDRKARTKIIMLLLRYGADVQWTGSNQRTLFDIASSSKNFDMIKFILARLAIEDVLGCKIKELIVGKIYSHAMFKNYYNFCKTKLAKMQRTIIHGSVSIFQLLTASESEIACFAQNEQFLARIKTLMYVKRRSKLYYYRVLRQQLMKMMQVAHLQQTIFNLVSQKSEFDEASRIVQKFIRYLRFENFYKKV